ncbi:MAG: hypothetical protein U0223_12065 [Nitrospira sp.]|nr:hypothetical protein [Nitrospira sp.]
MDNNEQLLQLALLAVPDVGDQDYIAEFVLKLIADVDRALVYIPSFLTEENQRRNDHYIVENRHATLPELDTASATFRSMMCRILDMPEGGFKDKFVQYVLARALEELAWNLITKPVDLVDLDGLRAAAENLRADMWGQAEPLQ